MSQNKLQQTKNLLAKKQISLNIIPMKKLFGKITQLRLEEFLAVVFLLPSAALTTYAYMFFAATGKVPRYIAGGMFRPLAAVIFFIALYFIAKYKDRHRILEMLREILPFALAVIVYTNLHDTVAFVNSGNIAPTLIRIDEAIFGGVNPILWAERFYNPLLTEFFSFCYMNFFWYSFTLGLLLWLSGMRAEFRTTFLGVILLFYSGYILYTIFPAVPPRIMLKPLFTKSLHGIFLTELADKIVNVSFATSRAAFPSLHCANTLLTLIYSYRYKKVFFWIFLPIALGLVLGTVYLRHHYVIDIVAGFILAIIIYFTAPIIERKWRALGAT